ncbi:MAG TPA: hypothetical protein VLC95_02740 [Anaerolineae bacterium]|nr:hypothetical protein [Anaerolineae bacterium]
MRNHNLKLLIRNFAIEMVVYSVLLVAYFYLALRFLGEPLKQMYETRMVVYAILALVLIVAQAVMLEALTSMIVRWLGLERLE